MGDSNVRPIMNLANSIVGVSILAMPYCFSQCGILLGTLLLVLCTCFTAWTCKMLMRAAIMTRNHSYENLALGVYGTTGKYTTGICVIGLNLGTCIAFFVIIGDLAPPIVAQATGLTWSPESLRAIVLILAALLIAFPLGLCRSIDSLSGISMCSLLFYALLAMQLLSISYPHFSWDLWTKLSWQLFVIYGALHDPTFRRISSVINGATLSIATLYFLVALFGCISFSQDGVKGDVLSNFNVSLMSQLCRFGFSLSVVVSFPLMIFPCRVSINSLFFSSKALELHVQEPIPRNRFVAITAVIIASTLTVAILVPNVETVLGLTGATMGSLIAFILPSYMFLKVAGSKADLSNRAKVCLTVGFAVMVLSTTAILQTEMNRTDGNRNFVVGIRPPPKPPDLPPPQLDALEVRKDTPPAAKEPAKEPAPPDNPDDPAEQDQAAQVVHVEGAVNIPTVGGGGGGVVKGVVKGGTVQPDVQSLHKEIKKGMSELQSRIDQLEVENKDLKERQEIIEQIQEDDLLQEPDVLEAVDIPAAERDGAVGGDPGNVGGAPAPGGGVGMEGVPAPGGGVGRDPGDVGGAPVGGVVEDSAQQPEVVKEEVGVDMGGAPNEGGKLPHAVEQVDKGVAGEQGDGGVVVAEKVEGGGLEDAEEGNLEVANVEDHKRLARDDEPPPPDIKVVALDNKHPSESPLPVGAGLVKANQSHGEEPKGNSKILRDLKSHNTS